MTTNKTVYFLIGPKGSGKSYIGRLLERTFGIRFPNLEALALRHIEQLGLQEGGLDRDGFDFEEALVNKILENEASVIFEATGSSIHFASALENLGGLYDLKLIRIFCPLDECFKRVKARNPDGHHFVADQRIREINTRASAVVFDWDLEINNSGSAPDKTIICEFNKII